MINYRLFIKLLLSFLLSTIGHLINIFIIFPFLVGEDGMGRHNTQEPDAMAAVAFCIFTIVMLLGGWFLLSVFITKMIQWPIWPCVVSLLLVIIGGLFVLRYV